MNQHTIPKWKVQPEPNIYRERESQREGEGERNGEWNAD